MLYLAEGGKRSNSRIVMTNTDPSVIKFFSKWIKVFLDVEFKEMRVQLHLYENMDFKKERDFWRKQLRFKDSQFYKDYISKLKSSSFRYESKFNHGTCSLYVFGVERNRRLMMAVKAFVDLYLDK